MYAIRSYYVCGGTANELDVVNIADKNNPYLLAAYDMQEPYGLGIDGNNLFICEGEFGRITSYNVCYTKLLRLWRYSQ